MVELYLMAVSHYFIGPTAMVSHRLAGDLPERAAAQPSRSRFGGRLLDGKNDGVWKENMQKNQWFYSTFIVGGSNKHMLSMVFVLR